MTYWIAHIRGAENSDLEKHGFVTFFPHVDDYAFLPTLKKNKRLLRKELSLKVYFLRVGEEYAEVSDEDLHCFKSETIGTLQPGVGIVVIEGPYIKMEGTLERVVGDTCYCSIKSYGSRTYDITLDRRQIAVLEDE